MLLLSQRAGAHTLTAKYTKLLILVKKLKVFGQAFFKRLAGVRGRRPRNTTCALQEVNAKTVLWTVLAEERLCKREPLL